MISKKDFFLKNILIIILKTICNENWCYNKNMSLHVHGTDYRKVKEIILKRFRDMECYSEMSIVTEDFKEDMILRIIGLWREKV